MDADIEAELPDADGDAEVPAAAAAAGSAAEQSAGGKRGAAAGKAASGRGRKSKVRKTANMRECQACFKMLDNSDFVAGTVYCRRDKKAINNLYNASSSQGELTWYHDQMNDHKKRAAMVAAYHEQCPEAPPGKKRATFHILQYKERVKTQHGELRDRIGEMMSEIAYIGWAAKPRNGGLDAVAASARWKERVWGQA
eukprot:7262087-Alexandrium_andersonii.AAC.1